MAYLSYPVRGIVQAGLGAVGGLAGAGDDQMVSLFCKSYHVIVSGSAFHVRALE